LFVYPTMPAAQIDGSPGPAKFAANALTAKVRQCGGVEFDGPRRYVSATSDLSKAE
jgi:hypothetical protein